MDPIYIFIACVLIAWLFVNAAWTKLRSPLRTVGVVNNYQILPFKASTGFVIGLAIIEILTVLLVLLPVSRQWGALFALLLLAAYGMAIAINLFRGHTDFDCGCSGPAERKTIDSSLLWRNAMLILVAVVAMAPMLTRPLQWFDYSVVVLAAAFFILMYRVVENLLVNNQQLLKL